MNQVKPSSDFGVQLEYFNADRSNPASIAEMVEMALEGIGSISCL
jgi:hypothetical protein